MPNGYGDVDLCLRMRAEGLEVVYSPYAVLEHHESATRSLVAESFEVEHMYRRWGAELVNDPYRNPNLSGDGQMRPDPGRALAEPSSRMISAWLQEGASGLLRLGVAAAD